MAAPSREGEILDGKYRILRKLGEGGMGAVYAGENTRVKKTVAIKILHASASAVEDMAQRFDKEAQAAGQIGNDHIVEVYDLGMTSAGERYMVMEYLDGESLRSRIRRLKRLGAHEILPVMVQMLEGLEAAHRAGIIHRDLKPDNVFLVKSRAKSGEFVKILDFGISKFTDSDASTTQAGTVMGSPNYMSPEHVKSSSEVDARSDVYAVGVMLYEALTGAVPRKAANFAELLFRVAYEPMPDPRKLVATIPDALVDVIFTACATAPAERFQTASDLSYALQIVASRIGAPLEIPAAPPSSPASLSGAALPPPPPSFRMITSSSAISAPGLAPPSQPSFGSASPSLAAFTQSNPALSARSLTGPNGDALAMGTEVISVAGHGSQPSFAGGPQPAQASGSQPNHASSSQPNYASGSQPNYASGSQPNYASGSQPSFANGSLPTFGSGPPGSQSGMGTTAGVALGAPLEPVSPRQGRGAGVALLAGLIVGALGLGGAAVYVATRPSAGPAAGSTADVGGTASVASAAAAVPAGSVDPSVASATTAQAATAEESALAAASASADARSSASAVARPIVVRPWRKKIPDPGY